MFRQKNIPQAIICFILITIARPAQAQGEMYSIDTSFTGGAGTTTTNAEHTLISSWRQTIQTLISTGGGYENASGFLAATAEDSDIFRVVAFGFVTNNTKIFHLTVLTQPGYNYVVQFTDKDDNSSWQQFLNTNQFIGSYLETNTTKASFTFIDDSTMATSGGSPLSAARFYRVIAVPPASAP